MDVVKNSRNSVAPHAMCSHERYCERCSQCLSSVGCEARYTGAGPGRQYLRACGCEREGMSAVSGPVIRRWARHASSKLARNRVGKSVWSVGAQPAETQTPVASRRASSRDGLVIRETTSRGLYGLVCPSRTSERGGEGYCVKGEGGEEGEF